MQPRQAKIQKKTPKVAKKATKKVAKKVVKTPKRAIMTAPKKAAMPEMAAPKAMAMTVFTKPAAPQQQKAFKAPFFAASPFFQPLRFMSDYGNNYQQDPKMVEQRVLDVMKRFSKVDETKLNPKSQFAELGLDSLDRVEVMLAIEEEFNLEFTDEQSDKFSSVFEVVDYIAKKPDIHLRTYQPDI
eukprot:UN02008